MLVGPEATALRAKALVAAVLDAVRVPWGAEQTSAFPFLHPGKSGIVTSGGTRLGFVGEVHPQVARAWEIEQPVAALALNLDVIAPLAPTGTTYADLISFPALRQDIASSWPTTSRRPWCSTASGRRAASC